MPLTDFLGDQQRRPDIRTVVQAKYLLRRPRYGMNVNPKILYAGDDTRNQKGNHSPRRVFDACIQLTA
jgi:hypothetical protein